MQFSLESKVEINEDSLTISVINPLHCPITIDYSTSKSAVNKTLEKVLPITINAFEDTLITIPCTFTKEELDGSMKVSFSTPDSVQLTPLSLPFCKKKKYKILQAYNSTFTHKGPYSKHSLDFALAENDTICAAADGYVVGVIEGYKDGGTTEKWRDYANFITIYHPKMNILTQYAHLVYNGSLVSVGDTIKRNQAIGLAGDTGFAKGEHLHFNVLHVVDSEYESIQVSFEEGYKGKDLKKGDWVEKP